RRKVEEYSALLAVMRRLVPEKNEVPALIDDISTKAKVRGVTIGRIEPQPVEAGPPFDTYRYRLEIIGHYDQLGEFLSDIARLPPRPSPTPRRRRNPTAPSATASRPRGWCAKSSRTKVVGATRSSRCSGRATSGRCCQTCGSWASTTTGGIPRAASRCCAM